MPTRNIRDRLDSGEVLLMDGGTGSEHIMAMREVVKGLGMRMQDKGKG